MNDLQELKTELTAPIKSFRLFALEKCMGLSPDPAFLSCLEECYRAESDEECLILFRHAINHVRKSLLNETPGSISVELLIEKFPGADADAQMDLIGCLRVSQIKGSNPESFLATLLSHCANDVVAAELVKKFRRFWPESLKNFLTKNVFSANKSLQIACIESLMKIFPESLKSQLHKLVNVNDPVIKSLAIWSMARFFPELAADFMQDCLEKGDFYSKITALKICSTLDFSLIKHSILNLIFAESEPRIFKAALTIVLSNPDKEVPFRLMEIMVRCDKTKAEYLKEFLPDYCENLKIAKVCEDYSSYTQTLEIYSKQLKARMYVHKMIENILNEAEGDLFESCAKLREQMSDDYIRSAALEYYESIKDERVKKVLSGMLSLTDDSHKNVENVLKDFVSNEFEAPEKPVEQQEHALIKEFARARFKKDPQTAQKVRDTLNNKAASNNLMLAAFKAAIHLSLDGFLALAKSWIEQEDEYRVAAALEYLEKFDKDEFHKATQKHINTNSFIVRKTLINATSKENPEYARFLIRHLLNSRDRSKRLNGLEATVQLDFSYIYSDLVAFLEKEDNPDLIQCCLSIFLANPRLDSLYLLRHIKSANNTTIWLFEDALQELEAIIQSSGIATEKEIASYYQKKEHEEKARKDSRKKAKELHEAKASVSWGEMSEQLAGIGNFGWKALAFGFLGVLMIAGFFLMRPSRQANKTSTASKTSPRATKTPSQALKSLPNNGSNTTVTLSGFDKANGTWTITDEKGSQFRAFIPDSAKYSENDVLEIEIKASRYSITGQVVVFVESAKKIQP